MTALATDLASYLADNYGRGIAITCQCRQSGRWLGRACLHWVPVKAKTWGELQNAQIVFAREMGPR